MCLNEVVFYAYFDPEASGQFLNKVVQQLPVLGEVTELIPISQFSNVVGDSTPIFFNTFIFNETIIYCAQQACQAKLIIGFLGSIFQDLKFSKKNVLTFSFFSANLAKSLRCQTFESELSTILSKDLKRKSFSLLNSKKYPENSLCK